jgi:23S rRNA G2069 N7-methylase RlmK/C1962 C5-methylase RlmI
MELKLGKNTYKLGTVKAKMIRKAMQLTEEINFDRLSVEDLDKLVQFIVELYGNKFTIDDVYENLDAQELVPTLNKCINALMGTFAEKMEQMPEKK